MKMSDNPYFLKQLPYFTNPSPSPPPPIAIETQTGNQLNEQINNRMPTAYNKWNLAKNFWQY